MGSENIFVKKKKKSLLAQLRETVLEITVLMQSCQKQAVAGAARTGAQPGPRCPAGAGNRPWPSPAFVSTPRRIPSIKSQGGVFAVCRGISPLGRPGGSQRSWLRPGPREGQRWERAAEPPLLSTEVTPEEPCRAHLAENSSVDFSTYTKKYWA